MFLPRLTRPALRFSVARFLQSTSLLVPAVTIGCMTPSHPPRPAVVESASADVEAAQSGKVVVAAHTFLDVYYPIPYATKPTLVVPDHWGNCVVVIQTPTRFRVLNNSGSELTAEWKARGPKAPVQPAVLLQPQVRTPAPTAYPPTPASYQPPPSPAAPRVAAPQSPGDGLPTEPVPITAPQR